MGCFYCDEHHEGREAIMFKVGDMKVGTLYLFRIRHTRAAAHWRSRAIRRSCASATSRSATITAQIWLPLPALLKKLWGCTKINLGSFGDSNPHLHFHIIVPKYEGGFEFGGSFAITNPEPVILKDEEYKEMIEALQKELGL